MTSRRTLIPVLCVLALGVMSACGSNTEPAETTQSVETTEQVEAESPAVSTECESAFVEMKDSYDRLYAEGDFTDAEANAAEIPPLNACATADEWLEAGRANPAALGYTDASTVDVMSIQIRRSVQQAISTPVCMDAEETGLLD